MANETHHEVALFEKDQQFGILAITYYSPAWNIVSRKDPREPNVFFTHFNDTNDARTFYQKSIETTLKNGWKSIYRGRRNQG